MEKILIFAVLKQWLLQQRETEAKFVYIIFAVLLVKIIFMVFKWRLAAILNLQIPGTSTFARRFA